jgi:hypothetical protein
MSTAVRLHVVGRYNAVTGLLWAYDDERRPWYGVKRDEQRSVTECEIALEEYDWRRAAPSRAPRYLFDDPVQNVIEVETSS